MSSVYSLWVNKMLKSREEARTLREMLSFTKKKEADPLMEYLVSFRDRMGHARKLLTDPALTAFFFVTLPEALPIAVVTRFIQWFKDFGIPVGGVLVNMVIDPALVGPNVADFVKNRVAMQQEHMQTIWREFGDNVRAIVPLFETEIRGVPMLQRLCDAIFAADGVRPAPGDVAGRLQEVRART
jgi:arsenite-transporting ATPase